LPDGAVDIRLAREDEFETLAKIWDESWVSTGVESPESLTLAQLTDRLRAFRLSGAIVYTVEQGQTCVGLIVTDPAAKKLSQLFLSPRAQRQGVGTLCLSFVTAQMPEGFTLTVAEDNRSAIAFYERQGLVCDERVYRQEYRRFDRVFRWPGADRS
jgi:ribosomal protein S18 acetylase RimI-like enzyme